MASVSPDKLASSREIYDTVSEYAKLYLANRPFDAVYDAPRVQEMLGDKGLMSPASWVIEAALRLKLC